MKKSMYLALMALASLASLSACRAVIPSLEIYDSVTGRSQVVENPLEIYGFNPQPEPPGVPLAFLRHSGRTSVGQMRDQF